jgi:hypothetical protein
VELTRDACAIALLLEHHIRADASHSVATRSERIQHLIHCLCEMRQVMVGQKRRRYTLSETAL